MKLAMGLIDGMADGQVWKGRLCKGVEGASRSFEVL